MTTKTIISSGGLNLRYLPTITSKALEPLPMGETVTLLDGYTAHTDEPINGKLTPLDWQAVTSRNRFGWVAAAINGQPTYGDAPPPPPGPTPSRSKIGLHILPGGASSLMVDYCRQYLPPCVTVVNDKALANQLADLVGMVIYREAGSLSDAPDYNSITDPYMTGRNWFRTRAGWLSGLDARVYVQFVNESVWTPKDPDFWRGVQMERNIQAPSRRLALFGDGVGNPNDDGQSAASKWQARGPVLLEAVRVGDIVSMHCYSAPGTPAGSLSSPGNAPYYEFRYRSLYASVSSLQRPRLVLSEAACEFSAGKFQGIDECVHWARALNAEIARDSYVVGACLWTVGNGVNWSQSSIDPALPALASVIRA